MSEGGRRIAETLARGVDIEQARAKADQADSVMGGTL